MIKIKKVLLIFALFILPFIFSLKASANETLLGSCIKEYPIKSGELYLKTLSTLYENKFEITEIQSKNGLILFRANRSEYLATVFVSKNGWSSLKILPTNSDFNTGIVVQNLVFAKLDEMLGRNDKQ